MNTMPNGFADVDTYKATRVTTGTKLQFCYQPAQMNPGKMVMKGYDGDESTVLTMVSKNTTIKPKKLVHSPFYAWITRSSTAYYNQYEFAISRA